MSGARRTAVTPELAEQRRAAAATRSAPPAPPGPGGAPPGPGRLGAPHPRRPVLGLTLATAGVAALTVVALLPGGAAPSLAAAASLAVRGPAAPAPAADPSHPGSLRGGLAGLRYPDWRGAFGWRSSGSRVDRLDGRAAITVYYTDGTRAMLGYTIVGGAPLPEPAGTVSRESGGARFIGLTRGGRSIVTWRRAGHTCVISATRVPLPTLLRLAGWRHEAPPEPSRGDPGQ